MMVNHARFGHYEQHARNGRKYNKTSGIPNSSKIWNKLRNRLWTYRYIRSLWYIQFVQSFAAHGSNMVCIFCKLNTKLKIIIPMYIA